MVPQAPIMLYSIHVYADDKNGVTDKNSFWTRKYLERTTFWFVSGTVMCQSATIIMEYVLLPVVILLCLLTPVSCIRCFDCNDMPTTHSCRNIVDCIAGEYCYLEAIVTASGNVLYNQGCRSQLKCGSIKRRSNVAIRADTDVITCEQCCATNYCNNAGCYQTVPPRNTRGPFCFHCESQAGVNSCRTIKTCAIDETCVILNTTDSSGEISFRSDCMYILQCHMVQNFYGDIVSDHLYNHCPKCCQEDFCNDNCLHNGTATSGQPVDGQWSSWNQWSTCSTSCGSGERTRIRMCNNPPPQHNGHPCIGDNLDIGTCNLGNCSAPVPVAGHWSLRSSWSQCNVTCGQGTKTRIRACDLPAPQHGGHDCSGKATETQTCDSQSHCTVPVDGHWSMWTLWSRCSVTCGQGTMTRIRACDHPAPQYGGLVCSGYPKESQSCGNQSNCIVPLDGQWSAWSFWSLCDVTCGQGTKSRLRVCDQPAPQHGGQDCHGLAIERLQCVGSSTCTALVDSQWSQWTQWSECSVTCGSGTSERIRSCSQPTPLDGGQMCSGISHETTSCQSQNQCPVHHCPSNYQYNSTVGCYFISTANVEYFEAAYQCALSYAYLLGVHNSTFDDHLESLLSSDVVPSHSIWLGIIWDSINQHWVWTTGQILLPSDYHKFQTSGITPGYPGHMCLVRTEAYWQPEPCDKVHSFICVRGTIA